MGGLLTLTLGRKVRWGDDGPRLRAIKVLLGASPDEYVPINHDDSRSFGHIFAAIRRYAPEVIELPPDVPLHDIRYFLLDLWLKLQRPTWRGLQVRVIQATASKQFQKDDSKLSFEYSEVMLDIAFNPHAIR